VSDLTNLAKAQPSKAEIASRAIARNTRARAIGQQQAIADHLDDISKLSNAEKIDLIFSDPSLSTAERAIKVAKLKSEGNHVFIEHRGGNKWQRVTAF